MYRAELGGIRVLHGGCTKVYRDNVCVDDVGLARRGVDKRVVRYLRFFGRFLRGESEARLR